MPTSEFVELSYDPYLLDVLFGMVDNSDNSDNNGDNGEVNNGFDYVYKFFTKKELDRLAVLLLTPQQYEVYYYAVQNLSQREIANLLNITQQAISERFIIMRKRFRQHYGME